MKINFNLENKRYTLCTVKEFADILGKMAANEPTSDKLKFIADFALTDIEKDDSINVNHMEDYIENASGWFGIKELGEVGFNDTDKHFVFDYYGGGKMMINSFSEDCLEEDCSADILKTLRYILDAEDSWYVLVQWDEEEYITRDKDEEGRNANKAIEDAARAIQQYEVVEVCPECGAENIIRWDVETEGYVAYCSHCGSKMMLCDECTHSDNAPICDWSPCNGCCREHERVKKTLSSNRR